MTEFWRRWHMTLGSWFKSYLYFPLGGSRCSKRRNFLNLFVVWAATGLWHGASWNFVIWGLYFFVLLMLEKGVILNFLNTHPVISRIYMIPLIMISWAIFALTDFSQMGLFFSRLFAFDMGDDWLYFLKNYGVTFLLGIIFATPMLKKPLSRMA